MEGKSCGVGDGAIGYGIALTWDHMCVPAKWHLIPSSGHSRVHECDRLTNHTTVTSVAIGGIANLLL